jgi:hypothetical protein
MRRSQAILRMPVNSVLATLILGDGERSDVLLFVPPGEDITSLISPGPPFVPMIRNARFCLVARHTIAALGVVTDGEPTDDGALLIKRQRARVRLCGGTTLEGELQWPASEVYKRTSDYVNDPASFIVIHAIEARTIHYVTKSLVATVEEL